MKPGIASYQDAAKEAQGGKLSLETDVCVVGSGAGGSLVAAELAAAGARVVVIEKGRHVPREAMTQREFEMSARLYDPDMLAPAMGSGARLPIVRGRCLGGSSVVADSICHDPPAELRALWARMGLGSWAPGREDLDRMLSEVRAARSVTRVQEAAVNRNNEIFRIACQRAGYSVDLVERNLASGTCHQCGFCTQGCRFGDKQSAIETHVPRAVKAGATFLTECEADHIERLPGARQRFRTSGTCTDRRLEAPAERPTVAVDVTSSRVVLAAGAIDTPRVILRSDQAFDPRHLAGAGLSVHYQTFVVGHLQGVKVRAHEGLPVACRCDEIMGGSPTRKGDPAAWGIWLDAAFSQPWNLATTFSFYGTDLTSMMHAYEELAGIMVYVTSQSRGRVSESSVRFDITPEDNHRLVLATQVAAGLLFKVGARKVWTGATRKVLADPRELVTIAQGEGYLTRDAFVFTSHPMGGACMGKDPAVSLVNEHGESHHAPGLFVADASAFPTPVGAPPYITVLLHARKVAERMKS